MIFTEVYATTRKRERQQKLTSHLPSTGDRKGKTEAISDMSRISQLLVSRLLSKKQMKISFDFV
jgi:hypothetical protein